MCIDGVLSQGIWHSCMIWVKVQGGYTTLTAKPKTSCLTITTGKRNVYASFHTAFERKLTVGSVSESFE